MSDFPGGPGVETSPSNAGGVGLIPGQGVKIPHTSWPKKPNIKQKQQCNKLNEKKFFLRNVHVKRWDVDKKELSEISVLKW